MILLVNYKIHKKQCRKCLLRCSKGEASMVNRVEEALDVQVYAPVMAHRLLA